MDPYKQMIDRPGFTKGKSLSDVLQHHVAETIRGGGIHGDPEESIYAVEGLAVAYGGLLGVAIDIPNFGRTRESNPYPSVNYFLATAAGYREEPLAF